jgi:hypothetical protein
MWPPCSSCTPYLSNGFNRAGRSRSNALDFHSSRARFEIGMRHCLSLLRFSWVSSVSPRKFWDSASNMSWPLPSKSITTHLSSYHPILMVSWYWKRREITNEMKKSCVIVEDLLPHKIISGLHCNGASVAPVQKFTCPSSWYYWWQELEKTRKEQLMV